jgi:hypothetical protein
MEDISEKTLPSDKSLVIFPVASENVRYLVDPLNSIGDQEILYLKKSSMIWKVSEKYDVLCTL